MTGQALVTEEQVTQFQVFHPSMSKFQEKTLLATFYCLVSNLPYRRMAPFCFVVFSAAIGWTSYKEVIVWGIMRQNESSDLSKRFMFISLRSLPGIEKNLASPSQYSERLAEKKGQVVPLLSVYRLQLVKTSPCIRYCFS